MSEFDFVTHMSKPFTDEYGEQLYQYFVNEAIYGKYLSASELWHSLSEKRVFVLPEKSNFCRDYKKLVTACKAIVDDTKLTPMAVDDFFANNTITIKEAKHSYTYWEHLFVYACFKSNCSPQNFNNVQNGKEKISLALNEIKKEPGWYKESIVRSFLWSIELFRLRFFLEKRNNYSFTFLQELDWLDIFEFRVMPVVLTKIISELCSENNKVCIKAESLLALINKKSDYPFAERLGIGKQSQRKSLWNLRRSMLPICHKVSDVNLDEDVEIFERLVSSMRKKAGIDITPLEQKEHILVLTSERNRIRNHTTQFNGNAYTYAFITKTNLGLLDTECMDLCLSIFKDIAQNAEISNKENVVSVIGIHHLLYHELREEEKDDLTHPKLSVQLSELEYTYDMFCKKVLVSVFYSVTENKALLMDISLRDDIGDELLSEMLMIGAEQLVMNSSDDILKKIFVDVPDSMDTDRNTFINKTWNSMDAMDRGLCCLHANDVGLLERINCTDKSHLSDDEKDFADKIAKHMISELHKVHKLFSC